MLAISVMKYALAFPAILALGLTACETLRRPIESGDFDPLRPPGTQSESGAVATSSFKAGEFVSAAMDNTAFFKARPKGDADADKLLKTGTSMKVISESGSYVKVELDSGEVGFVPSVMLEGANATPINGYGSAGELQVVPPINEEFPAIEPGEQPPGEAIPAVIDPEAPAATDPVAPVEPASESAPAPLPPNGEEEETETE
jgi:hypothetical protein